MPERRARAHFDVSHDSGVRRDPFRIESVRGLLRAQGHTAQARDDCGVSALTYAHLYGQGRSPSSVPRWRPPWTDRAF